MWLLFDGHGLVFSLGLVWLKMEEMNGNILFYGIARTEDKEDYGGVYIE